jgi:hypothetical protein
VPISKSELERELDRLYQLPLSEFTSARDELAKRLRSEGERERADEVKTLRKPNAGVWLVNQLARERELDVQRLLKAGESLTKSQATAAAGKSSQKFLEARRDEQQALERLARAAREIAEREGVGTSALAKATETLRAASLTAEGRELLKRGRLSEDLEPPGFEALAGLNGVARGRSPEKAKRPRKDSRTEKRRLLKDARQRIQRLRADERELTTAARAAERDAEHAEKEAAAARRRAEDAREEARTATEQREAAETALDRLK